MQRIYSNCAITIFSLALSLTGTAYAFNLTYFSIDNPRHSHHPNKSLVMQKNTPITTDEENVWFSDMRMKLDISNTTNHNEVNLGIAHRKSLPHQENTIGTYAFWDISHIKDQVFAQQTTLGIEWLNLNTHIATNVYLPLSSFATDLQYWDSLPQEKDWRHTQQNGLLRSINTLAGADINLSKSVVLNPAQKIGVDVQYGYFTSTKHTEQGPTIGLVLTNKSSRQETNYELFGSYNSYHKTSLGVRTETQWLNNLTPKRTGSSSNIYPLIKRDIDIRTTPVDERPYIKVKSVQGSYPNFGDLHNSIIREYLGNNFNVIYVQDEQPSDLLVMGPVWLWTNEPDVISSQIELVRNDPAKIKIFYAGEAENSNPDPRILDVVDLMISSALTDEPKHFRYNWGYYYSYGKYITLDKNDSTLVSPYRKSGCNPDEKKFFACFLTSNSNEKLYPGVKSRIALFDKLSQYKFIASPGKTRNNMDPIPKYGNGTTDFFNQCKFVIAYENQHSPGYITEKPFRAWTSGAIPIYDSDPTTEKDLNTGATIYAREFENEEQMIDEIKYLDTHNHDYCEKWNKNIIDKPHQEWKTVHDSLYNRLDSIFTEKLGFPGQ